MRTRHLAIAASAFLLAGSGWAIAGADATKGIEAGKSVETDTQLRAMRDELNRSRTLAITNLDKPYFIEYTTSDADNVLISGSLGGITSSEHVRLRQPGAEIRVGDYKFDNTNSIYSGKGRLGLFPVDDDYQAIRNDLWLSTDGLYKAAIDQITRKRTALREIADPDQTPDLAPVKAVEILEPAAKLDIDQKHWQDTVQKASGRFAEHPGVMASNVTLRAISTTYRLVNSEGTTVRIPQELSAVEILSSAFAPDGSRVWNHRFFTALRPAELPGEEELSKGAEEVARETEALTKAPVAEEFSGPVLFEQEAAAEMMAQVLTDTIRLQRKPLAPPGSESRSVQAIESVWSSRVGSMVTPEWMTIYDNPREEKYGGSTLAGHYLVDDEGVPSQKVMLVEKGVFKGFLFSREPVRKFNESNGHGRLPGGYGSEAAVIGNLFVQADKTIPEAKMKERLLKRVKAAGLKYGLVVRRMDFPSTANFQELQSIARQLQKNGYARTLNAPLLAYRVYPDGREELIRGARFSEFSAKDLRDVEAASDRPYVLNYLNNGSSYNLANSNSDGTTSSVICPSLLFDNVDLARAEDEAGKPPIVPPPALVAQK